MNTSKRRVRFLPFSLPLLAVLAIGCIAPASADDGGGGGYGPLPPIGSKDVSIADPVVARPSTTPCEVVLFDNLEFNDYTPRDFSYTPPTDCPGPWAKVVLEFDAYVTAGIQFDRTATIWLDGVNLLFGTTPEPAPSLSPSWHVERDLTDYSALFTGTQAGDVYIGNTVDAQYTGVIYGTGTLQFYPLPANEPAPVVPDQVVALGGVPGGTVDLASPTQTLSQTLTLPTNIERAYLDVFAQSQYQDEFWWSCLPDVDAQITGDCPGTAFREVELTIDGQPAGVAPIYPLVYTGGVNPNLWIPIPGLQTLNFLPYRVDFTPFAGLFDDGNPHTIALSVFNTHDHFSTTAALLLYLDAGSTAVTGAVTTNTLGAAPTPVITGSIASNGIGTVSVDSNRQFTIAGYVNTSHGRVDTQVDQTFAFDTTTTYTTASNETITQSTTVDTTTTVANATPASTTVTQTNLSYPFSFGAAGNVFDFDQALDDIVNTAVDGVATFNSTLSNHVTSHFQGALASRHSEQDYEYNDSTGSCYSRDITSVANALATVTDAVPCIAADTIFQDGFDGTD